MSQNKFVSLPVLSLNPSRILLGFIIVLHTLALASVMLLIYFHIVINVVIGILIICSFCYYILYYKNVSSLKMIKCRADGQWILGYDTKPLLVSLENEMMLSECLIILRFKIGRSQKRTIPIFNDMMDFESFKKLRVALPFILKHSI